jgi:hypothetical protein
MHGTTASAEAVTSGSLLTMAAAVGIDLPTGITVPITIVTGKADMATGTGVTSRLRSDSSVVAANTGAVNSPGIIRIALAITFHTVITDTMGADLGLIRAITTLGEGMAPRALPRHAMAIITQVGRSVAAPAATRIMGDTISLRTIANTDITRVIRKRTSRMAIERATTTASPRKGT